MASSTHNSPEPEESSFSVPIVARLIVHIASQGKKKTIKKDTKTKEFSHTFSATKSNYLEFLTTILSKHHISNKLEVTDRRRYTCKMQVPPAK
jgi:ribosomal protein S7